MKKVPDAKVIVFNAAAVLIAVAAAAAVIRSWVFTPTAAPCSERYTSSTAFSWTTWRSMSASASCSSRMRRASLMGICFC